MSCSVDGGAAGSWRLPKRGSGSPGMLPKPNMIRTGTGPLALTGTTTAILTSTVIAGWAESSACPITRRAATGGLDGLGDRPRDLRHVAGHAAVDLALEVIEDLRAPLPPPHLGARDSPAVLQRQYLRPVRMR